MPTYGYRCTSCNHTFERFQKITDAPVAECETCGAPVKKMLYPVGIAFKGSGFYVNDYAPSGESSKRKADTEAPTTAPTTDAPKAETKTDTKTESAPATSAPATPAPAPKSE